MQYPVIWKAGNLVDHCLRGEAQESADGGRWQPCRPLGMPTLRNRVHAAWLVFTGRADALLWEFPMQTSAAADDEPDCCIACGKPFKDGDRYYPDASGGELHAECCGPERESYTGADGEPLGPDDPIPEPLVWREDEREG